MSEKIYTSSSSNTVIHIVNRAGSNIVSRRSGNLVGIDKKIGSDTTTTTTTTVIAVDKLSETSQGLIIEDLSSSYSGEGGGDNGSKNTDLQRNLRRHITPPIQQKSTTILSEESESILKDHIPHRRTKSFGNMSTLSIAFVLKRLRICISRIQFMNSTRLLVLIVLSLQNSLFTVLRRYSQGVLKENYSTYECLLLGEIIKVIFSAYMIRSSLQTEQKQRLQQQQARNETASLLQTPPRGGSDDLDSDGNGSEDTITNKSINTIFNERITFVIQKSGKMFGLALIYGAMNILSFVSLRNIGAGMFTIFAQCKILTTATFSCLLLGRQYSYTKWRALAALMAGVLLFSEPIWGRADSFKVTNENASTLIGTAAVITEVTLSGFASIYFEKVIKLDPLQLNIWERNFQLALGSFPVYLGFIAWTRGGQAGLLGGWSIMGFIVASLGAAGGILVALSIKYGDAILKTLATTAAIVLSSFLDHMFLNGPLTPTMCIAAFQVIIAIANYSFDSTPEETTTSSASASSAAAATDQQEKDTHNSNTNKSIDNTPTRDVEDGVQMNLSRRLSNKI